MTFTFFDMAGEVLFVRSDAEQAEWTVEEMTLNADFQYVEDKVISIGQRIFFIDPSTGDHQVYEVKNAKNLEPDHFQQVTAENICISELSDEHMDGKTVENVSCSAALSGVLSGSLWQVGEISVNPVSSAELSRGSVWQSVLQIRDNWNVYIEPRVSVSSTGEITRYLDIKPTAGVFNGLRLSIDKNFLDPTVTMDDSEVATALYGYGGTEIATEKGQENVETTFEGIAWEATADHPAKPLGQKYIEYPAATAEYGRNGRPRFGYYQNTEIDSPDILLQKTWEALKNASTPEISIEGTVADLYRMGYADEPIRLHDIALVEIAPSGFTKQIQIIKLSVNLLDPTASTLTIGSYIPNIVYIERKTNESVTGSRGGGGGNKSKQTERSEYETEILKSNRAIMLRAYQQDLDKTDAQVAIQEARITVESNRITQEVIDRRDADNVLNATITVTASQIRSEVSASNSTIYSTIEQTATQIRSEVAATDSALSSSITQTASQIRSEVAATDSSLSSSIEQTASQIRSEVAASDSTLYSTIEQTATQIRSEVASTDSALSSSISQTASQIRSEVSSSNSTIYSTIEQTATQIRTEIASTDSSLYSTIEQTATQIRSEVAESNSTVYSTIEQTATQIRSEVAATDSALSSSITQNSDKISLVVTSTESGNEVNSAEIVAGINGQTGSFVKIKADTINLSGYVTASQLEATDAKITNLMTGNATATWLKAGAMSCTGNFYLGGSYVYKHTTTVVTGVNFTDQQVTTTDISYLG